MVFFFSFCFLVKNRFDFNVTKEDLYCDQGVLFKKFHENVIMYERNVLNG